MVEFQINPTTFFCPYFTDFLERYSGVLGETDSAINLFSNDSRMEAVLKE